MDTINPLQYKANMLLYKWIALIVEPASRTFENFAHLALIALGINLIWALALIFMLRKAERIPLSFRQGYLLALPASLFYAPIMLTIAADVSKHAFHFQDRYILLLALFTISQTLAAFYAFAVRYPRNDQVIGLPAGLSLSLYLLVISIPASLILLGLDNWLHYI